MIKSLPISAAVMVCLMGINLSRATDTNQLIYPRYEGMEAGEVCEDNNLDSVVYQGKMIWETLESGWKTLTCIGTGVGEHPDRSSPRVSIISGSYLCVANVASGISYNKSTMRWGATNFFLEDLKWIVAPSKPSALYRNPSHKYEVTQLGDPLPTFTCEEGFNEFGFLSCTRGLFRLNNVNGRFVMASIHGYSHVHPGKDWIAQHEKAGIQPPSDEASDPLITVIGKCSPFAP